MKTTVPALNRKKPQNNLELAVPNNYLLLYVFHGIDLFKLAICTLHIKQSFSKIQINRDCNPQNGLVEKSFTLRVWLNALDVTAATLHPVSEHSGLDLWPYKHGGEES